MHFLLKTQLKEILEEYREEDFEFTCTLYNLAKHFEHRTLKKDEVVFQIGDEGFEFYLILKGTVAILKLSEEEVQCTVEEYLEILKQFKGRNEKLMAERTIGFNKEKVFIQYNDLELIFEKIFLKKLIKYLKYNYPVEALQQIFTRYKKFFTDYGINLAILQKLENDQAKNGQEYTIYINQLVQNLTNIYDSLLEDPYEVSTQQHLNIKNSDNNMISSNTNNESLSGVNQDKCDNSRNIYPIAKKNSSKNNIFAKNNKRYIAENDILNLEILEQKKVFLISKYEQFCLLGQNDFFGDFALDTNSPRTATLIGYEEQSHLAVLNKKIYNQYLMKHKKKIEEKRINFLYESVFRKFANRATFAKKYFNSFILQEFPKGHTLYKEKDQLDYVYVIYTGSVELSIEKNYFMLEEKIKEIININPEIKKLSEEKDCETFLNSNGANNHNNSFYYTQLMDNNFANKINSNYQKDLKLLKDELSKKKHFLIAKISSKEILGLENYIFKLPLQYKAVVVSEKVACFKIAVKHFNKLIKYQEEAQEIFQDISTKKLLSLTMRLKVLSKSFYEMIKNKNISSTTMITKTAVSNKIIESEKNLQLQTCNNINYFKSLNNDECSSNRSCNYNRTSRINNTYIYKSESNLIANTINTIDFKNIEHFSSKKNKLRKGSKTSVDLHDNLKFINDKFAKNNNNSVNSREALEKTFNDQKNNYHLSNETGNRSNEKKASSTFMNIFRLKSNNNLGESQENNFMFKRNQNRQLSQPSSTSSILEDTINQFKSSFSQRYKNSFKTAKNLQTVVARNCKLEDDPYFSGKNTNLNQDDFFLKYAYKDNRIQGRDENVIKEAKTSLNIDNKENQNLIKIKVNNINHNPLLMFPNNKNACNENSTSSKKIISYSDKEKAEEFDKIENKKSIVREEDKDKEKICSNYSNNVILFKKQLTLENNEFENHIKNYEVNESISSDLVDKYKKCKKLDSIEDTSSKYNEKEFYSDKKIKSDYSDDKEKNKHLEKQYELMKERGYKNNHISDRSFKSIKSDDGSNIDSSENSSENTSHNENNENIVETDSKNIRLYNDIKNIIINNTNNNSNSQSRNMTHLSASYKLHLTTNFNTNLSSSPKTLQYLNGSSCDAVLLPNKNPNFPPIEMADNKNIQKFQFIANNSNNQSNLISSNNHNNTANFNFSPAKKINIFRQSMYSNKALETNNNSKPYKTQENNHQNNLDSCRSKKQTLDNYIDNNLKLMKKYKGKLIVNSKEKDQKQNKLDLLVNLSGNNDTEKSANVENETIINSYQNKHKLKFKISCCSKNLLPNKHFPNNNTLNIINRTKYRDFVNEVNTNTFISIAESYNDQEVLKINSNNNSNGKTNENLRKSSNETSPNFDGSYIPNTKEEKNKKIILRSNKLNNQLNKFPLNSKNFEKTHESICREHETSRLKNGKFCPTRNITTDLPVIIDKEIYKERVNKSKENLTDKTDYIKNVSKYDFPYLELSNNNYKNSKNINSYLNNHSQPNINNLHVEKILTSENSNSPIIEHEIINSKIPKEIPPFNKFSIRQPSCSSFNNINNSKLNSNSIIHSNSKNNVLSNYLSTKPNNMFNINSEYFNLNSNSEINQDKSQGKKANAILHNFTNNKEIRNIVSYSEEKNLFNKIINKSEYCMNNLNNNTSNKINLCFYELNFNDENYNRLKQSINTPEGFQNDKKKAYQSNNDLNNNYFNNSKVIFKRALKLEENKRKIKRLIDTVSSSVNKSFGKNNMNKH